MNTSTPTYSKLNMPYKQVPDLDALKTGSPIDCFIQLNFGVLSRKTITWSEKSKQFYVWNHIDDTDIRLSEEEIMDERVTNVGRALKLGALYYDKNS